ncbi:MAG TPA: GNAT family N-acetyltransferase [Candidatus Elarobacter sp.]|jgi:predicted N-acetyltransferase YhbS
MTTATRAPEIRELAREGEDPALFAALARLLADAYPIMRRTTTEALDAYAETLRASLAPELERTVVAERDGALAGSMRLYDYTMNVRGRDALTGGVGSVAVSTVFKRQGIARALIAWYLEHYRRRDAAFAILHAFRLDFYRALGFGYGTPVQRYRFAPATLRDEGARGTVRTLGAGDAEALLACDERVRAATHGLIRRHPAAVDRALGDAALRYVAVEDDGAVRAFMQTTAVPAGDDLRNRDEVIVRDLTFEDETYLAALLRYLRSQRDQFARIVVESQDAALYLLSDDPRDGSDEAVAPPAAHRVARTGLGVMYRLLDVERAFGYLPAAAAPFTLNVRVEDAFFAPTAGAWTFAFGPGGAPRAVSDGATAPDAVLTIGIADLASVVLGSLSLHDVVRARLARLEPSGMLARVAAAFAVERPPVCTTRF